MAQLLDPTEIFFTAYEPKVSNRFIMYVDGIPSYLIKAASRPSIDQGEIVLDLGSGFGVDAMLAGTKVGSNGRVVGVDLSVREVSEANKRVLEKGITNVSEKEGERFELDLFPILCTDMFNPFEYLWNIPVSLTHLLFFFLFFFFVFNIVF